MSQNIEQIYVANPITSNASTDLMYFGQSPYGASDDAAMTYANFSAQFTGAGAAVLLNPAGPQTILTFGLTAPSFTSAGNFTTTGPGAFNAGSSAGGYSGTGFVCYSPTATSGYLQFVANNSGGNFAGELTNSSLSASRTWQLPDASGTIALTSGASGIVNPGLINQLAYYAAAGSAISGLATANNGFLLTNSSGAPAIGNSVGGGLTCTAGNIICSSANFYCGTPSGSSPTPGYVVYSPTGNHGYMFLEAIDNNAGNFNTTINNAASVGQSQVITIPDAGTSTANFVLAPSALVSGNIPKASGTSGLIIDSGIAASSIATTTTAVLLNPSGPQTINTFGLTAGSFTSGGNFAATGSATFTAGSSAGGYAGLGYITYSPTALKGFMEFYCNDNSGNFGINFTNDAFGQASAIILPDPGASSAHVLLDTSATGKSLNYQLNMPSIGTAPAASQSSTLALGTAYQNVLGYDIVLTVYIAVTSATAASILCGVGPTSTPTQQTIVSGLTLAALSVIPITIYLPKSYYALISNSGTITDSISGQQAMPV